MENNQYKCLSILQPWASLCVHTDSNGKALKEIETRSWNTKYRGELLIHSSAKKIRLQDGMYDLIDHMERIGFMENYSELPYGSIIGKVNLISTISSEDIQFAANSGAYPDKKTIVWTDRANHLVKKWYLTEKELAFGDYSENRFGWLLSDPLLFKEPIPCKGQLSIWNLPAELVPLVNRQIEMAL